MPKCQAWNNEIIAHMYGLQISKLWIDRCPATQQEIRVRESDNTLGRHAQTTLNIGLDFVEPVDDDVQTNEERRLGYSDDESEKEDTGDDVDSGDWECDSHMDDMDDM